MAGGPASRFPYDIHAYDEVAPRLTTEGARVITPYLRGYGPTRFLSPSTLRSGQQAALGADLLALLDALQIGQAILGGYDWGGRAACIVAALCPSRVRGLVSVDAYNIQNIANALLPADPEKEYRMWYQYYLHGERGRAGLIQNRRTFCRLLWSPTWRVDDDVYARSAVAFDNPDFVDVLVHSYRHRFGLADGDPRFENVELKLCAMPSITVPTITLEGDADGVSPSGAERQTRNASQDVTRTGSWLMQVTIFRRRRQKRLPTQCSTSTHGPFELESMPPACPSMSQAATRAARCV
jgi:pimeloyl-ACP methyl ester carboxylesterase